MRNPARPAPMTTTGSASRCRAETSRTAAAASGSAVAARWRNRLRFTMKVDILASFVSRGTVHIERRISKCKPRTAEIAGSRCIFVARSLPCQEACM